MKIGEKFNPYRLFFGLFIPNAIAQYPKLSAGAKLCYGRLSQYAGEKGYAYPSYKTLAKELGCGERSIYRYIKELVDQGFIEAIHRKKYNDKESDTNLYAFVWHEILDEDKKVQIPVEIESPDKKTEPPVKLAEPPLSEWQDPPVNLAPKYNHLKESKEENQNTDGKPPSEAFNDIYLKLQKIVNGIGEVDIANSGIVNDFHLGHLANESRRKKIITNKFADAENKIPAIINNWDKEGVKKPKPLKEGAKVKVSPKNSNTIITLYKDLFKEYFGGVAPITLEKDKALIAKLIKHYGYDYVSELFTWTFKNWSTFVREKKIKGVPTVGIIWGFRAYIQSKIPYQSEEEENKSEW